MPGQGRAIGINDDQFAALFHRLFEKRCGNGMIDRWIAADGQNDIRLQGIGKGRGHGP